MKVALRGHERRRAEGGAGVVGAPNHELLVEVGGSEWRCPSTRHDEHLPTRADRKRWFPTVQRIGEELLVTWRQAPIGRRLRDRAGGTCAHEQHRAAGEANRPGTEDGAGSTDPTELVVEANAAIHIKPSAERFAFTSGRS
jgi:hypothetical protein